jgi:hypothetical protein
VSSAFSTAPRRAASSSESPSDMRIERDRCSVGETGLARPPICPLQAQAQPQMRRSRHLVVIAACIETVLV